MSLAEINSGNMIKFPRSKSSNGCTLNYTDLQVNVSEWNVNTLFDKID